MSKGWEVLTKLTAGAAIEVERVRVVESDVVIEGPFSLPPLAQLTIEDQVFVAAFVRCHGSIKQMEKFFGVSYPTIKNRLNRIGEQLPFAEFATAEKSNTELLDRLEKGEMSVKDILEEIQKREIQS